MALYSMTFGFREPYQVLGMVVHPSRFLIATDSFV